MQGGNECVDGRNSADADVSGIDKAWAERMSNSDVLPRRSLIRGWRLVLRFVKLWTIAGASRQWAGVLRRCADGPECLSLLWLAANIFNMPTRLQHCISRVIRSTNGPVSFLRATVTAQGFARACCRQGRRLSQQSVVYSTPRLYADQSSNAYLLTMKSTYACCPSSTMLAWSVALRSRPAIHTTTVVAGNSTFYCRRRSSRREARAMVTRKSYGYVGSLAAMAHRGEVYAKHSQASGRSLPEQGAINLPYTRYCNDMTSRSTP